MEQPRGTGDTMLREYWTDSQANLVLVGPQSEIAQVAERLGIEEDVVINTRHGYAMLGIIGDLVEPYQKLRPDLPLEEPHVH